MHDAADDAEDRGGRADAERQGEDRGDGEPRSVDQQPDGDTNVLRRR